MTSSEPSRTWTEALDNLGENLIRLGSSFRAREEKAGGLASDEEIVTAIGPLASKYAAAFGQTQSVLATTEKHFLKLRPSGEDDAASPAGGEVSPQKAETLVHEAILSTQEIISLLDHIARAGQIDAARTREVLQPSLHEFSDSAVTVGWELRTICHEFSAEAKLVGSVPSRLEDLGHGAALLTHEMVSAARLLRSTRKAWFRIDQRLTALIGGSTGGKPSTKA